MDIFGYGMLLYGSIGALLGIGFGAAMGLLALSFGLVRDSLNTFSLMLAGWFSLNIFVLGRFRLFRDIWKEQALPMAAKITLGLVCLCLFLVIFFISRRENSNSIKKAKKALVTSLIFITVGLIPWIAISIFPGKVHTDSSRSSLNSESAPNVIVIMCDALRADHLGCYGYKHAKTPTIDKLAEESVRFHDAFSQASWTKPGTASLFTGLYPSGHNAQLKPEILPDSVVTLAETFQNAGYHTIGFPNNINISGGFNFDQGFDQYIYLSPDYFFGASESGSQLAYYSILRLVRERYLFKSKYPRHYYQEAAVVNQYAIEYLRDRDRKEKFFMFLHYMEPHDPYFTHPFTGIGYARVDIPNPDPSYRDVFLKAYDQEISYMDTRINELFQVLKDNKLWDNTIIVLTADHGEEFYDHQGWWHGTTLYQEQIRIPLIFKLQNSEMQGQIRQDYARQIDIAPTLLSLAKVPPPDEMSFGRNLFNPINGEGKDWFVLSEENHEGNVLSSYIEGPWKYINANPDNPRGLAENELYRLDLDYREKHNLAPNESDMLLEMKVKLDSAKSDAANNAVRAETMEISDEVKEKMKAIGYSWE